jgi:acetyltransferase-like isoleucine patch superfamily enzyme
MVGDDCFISRGVMFINDPFVVGGPAKSNKKLWNPTFVGNNVSIETNSTVLHVKIVDAVVTKDILTSGVYEGNPAKLIRNL